MFYLWYSFVICKYIGIKKNIDNKIYTNITLKLGKKESNIIQAINSTLKETLIVNTKSTGKCFLALDSRLFKITKIKLFVGNMRLK